MQSTYDEALRRVLVHEGGYSNLPSDPGGPTNFGITIQDYRKYIKPRGTAADVRNMTVDEAKIIYREHYGKPLRYDDLPAGVDYAVFDYGVNSGIGRAAKVLQRLVSAEDDGKIGDATLAAVRKRDAAALVNAICDERLRFLQGLRTWSVFGNGWRRRVLEVREAALAMTKMTGGSPPTEPAPGKGRITQRNGPVWSGGFGVAAAAAAAKDWVLAHPLEAAALAVVIVGGAAIAATVWHRATFSARQDAPTPGVIPIPPAA